MGDYRLALKAEGPNPLYWANLNALLGFADISFRPEPSYMEQAEVVSSLGGLDYGRGYPIATWYWAALTTEQRAILRTFCPGLSAEVYIETPTNEITLCGEQEFIQCAAIMHWPSSDEDIQSEKAIGFSLKFTHLVEVE